MKVLFIIISIAGLLLTVVPSILVFTQDIALESHKQFMLWGMLMWFITAPLWIKEQEL
jgi:hypothetical protein